MVDGHAHTARDLKPEGGSLSFDGADVKPSSSARATPSQLPETPSLGVADTARREQAVLLSLADELHGALDAPNEAASLPDWPDNGCSEGCIGCIEKWLRARADALT